MLSFTNSKMHSGFAGFMFVLEHKRAILKLAFIGFTKIEWSPFVSEIKTFQKVGTSEVLVNFLIGKDKNVFFYFFCFIVLTAIGIWF